MPPLTRQGTLDERHSRRVDRLVQELTGLSRAQVRGLFDHGCVKHNGRVVAEPGARGEVGDAVEVAFDPHQRYREKAKPWHDPTFRIVSEDDHLIVVNKAAHALTVPTGMQEADTVVDRLTKYLRRSGRRDAAHVVHRLDRGTSGLLVFGKTAAIAAKIKDQFADHKPRRRYAAIVAGHVKPDTGTIDTHLATDAKLSRYSVKRPRDNAERAITHFKVVQRLKGATLLSVRLETGKRNQIRVHMAEMGHPVLGDGRYRKDLSRHPRWQAKRLALHAAELGFTHPVTGKAVQFEAPLPGEFVRFLAATR